MTERDAALLRRARQGEQKAFDEVVARHGALVLGVARRVLGRSDDSEDVAQEVFLRLFRTLDRLDVDRPLEPWLVRVTLNAARNHRARDPARRESALSGGAEEPSVAPDAPGELETADLGAALREAAKELPPRQREVFLLRDLEGLESAVVGTALGISAVTVRRLSAEAKQRVVAWVRENRPELLAE